jgi:hypothetical protein
MGADVQDRRSMGHASGRFSVKRRTGARFVRVAIVATVAVVSLAAVHSSVKATSSLAGPAVKWTSTIRYDQQTCLQAAVRRSVPKGALVYLATSRVTEKPIMIFEAVLVSPWADPATRPKAQWAVSIDREGRACHGLSVSARRI